MNDEQKKQLIKELAKDLSDDDLGEIAAYFGAVLGLRRQQELVDAYHRPNPPVVPLSTDSGVVPLTVSESARGVRWGWR
jgi:hypothetical protein